MTCYRCKALRSIGILVTGTFASIFLPLTVKPYISDCKDNEVLIMCGITAIGVALSALAATICLPAIQIPVEHIELVGDIGENI